MLTWWLLFPISVINVFTWGVVVGAGVDDVVFVVVPVEPEELTDVVVLDVVVVAVVVVVATVVDDPEESVDVVGAAVVVGAVVMVVELVDA